MRGLFSDRGAVSWLPFFPNTATALTRFPSTSAVSQLFEEAGFARTALIDVDNGGVRTSTGGGRVGAAHAERRRLLSAFSDSHFEAGVAALEVSPARQLPPTFLPLMVLTKRRPRG